jgi:hypothetical protein
MKRNGSRNGVRTYEPFSPHTNGFAPPDIADNPVGVAPHDDSRVADQRCRRVQAYSEIQYAQSVPFSIKDRPPGGAALGTLQRAPNAAPSGPLIVRNWGGGARGRG